MTNKQKCINQWRWIVAHPGSSKDDWAEAHRVLAKEIEEHSLCHACLEVYLRNTGCNKCPINWYTTKRNHCCYGKNVYNTWNQNKTKQNAQAVLEVIKNTWR